MSTPHRNPSPHADSDSDHRWSAYPREGLPVVTVFDIETKQVPSPILGPDGAPARIVKMGMAPIGFVHFEQK